jgi:hypothetical protein
MATETEAREAACRADLGAWVTLKLGLKNPPFLWEWYDLAQTRRRLVVVAPREHGKSSAFAITQTCWRCRYTPGFWAFVFTSTADLAKRLKERVDTTMWEAHPWMMEGAHALDSSRTVFANWSRVDVRGAGVGVRGLHPDLIVGDDVLDEENTRTAAQRRQVERWWSGTVGPMAHPGVERTIGSGPRQETVRMPPTRVHLVGTPFHGADLLMGLRANPVLRVAALLRRVQRGRPRAGDVGGRGRLKHERGSSVARGRSRLPGGGTVCAPRISPDSHLDAVSRPPEVGALTL